MSRLLRFGALSTATLLSLSLSNSSTNQSWFWSPKDPFKTLKPSETSSFLWGEGQYQAKPGRSLAFPNFKPKLLQGALKRGDDSQTLLDLPDLVDLETSRSGIRLGVDSEGRVWSFESERMMNIQQRGKKRFVKTKADQGMMMFGLFWGLVIIEIMIVLILLECGYQI